jgi:acylphosphatase
MSECRRVLIIEGRVPRGGFRSFIKKRALMLGVSGYAENLPSGEVVVVLEGAEESTARLVEAIKKDAPAFIDVERITERRGEYRGGFADFERKGSDVLEGLEDKGVKEVLMDIASYSRSTNEKLERGVEILGEIKTAQDEHIDLTRQILKKQDTMLEKQDTMLEKQDTMLEKQDQHIDLTKQILKKQDEHIQVTKKGFNAVTGELKGFSELHEEIRELREEFTRLKESLRDAGISVN